MKKVKSFNILDCNYYVNSFTLNLYLRTNKRNTFIVMLDLLFKNSIFITKFYSLNSLINIIEYLLLFLNCKLFNILLE